MSHVEDDSRQQLVQRLRYSGPTNMAMQATALVHSLHISLHYGKGTKTAELFSFLFSLVFLVCFVKVKHIAHTRLRPI